MSKIKIIIIIIEIFVSCGFKSGYFIEDTGNNWPFTLQHKSKVGSCWVTFKSLRKTALPRQNESKGFPTTIQVTSNQ